MTHMDDVHDYMDIGGTSPWKGEDRIMQEAIIESNAGNSYRGSTPRRLHGSKRYDSTEGIGRVESGTETENDSGDKVEIWISGACVRILQLKGPRYPLRGEQKSSGTQKNK